jgi:hypothetical protein
MTRQLTLEASRRRVVPKILDQGLLPTPTNGGCSSGTCIFGPASGRAYLVFTDRRTPEVGRIQAREVLSSQRRGFVACTTLHEGVRLRSVVNPKLIRETNVHPYRHVVWIDFWNRLETCREQPALRQVSSMMKAEQFFDPVVEKRDYCRKIAITLIDPGNRLVSGQRRRTDGASLC